MDLHVESLQPRLFELACSVGAVLFLYGVYVAYDTFWGTPLRYRRMLESQGIKGAPFVPVVGNLPTAREMERKNVQDPSFGPYSLFSPFAFELFKKCGSVSYFFFGYRLRLLLADPAVIRSVYVSNNTHAYKTNVIRRLLGVFNNGLLLSNGYLWSRQRHLINPAFKQGAVKRMFPIFMQCTQQHMKKLRALVSATKAGEVHYFERPLTAITLEIIARAAFGASLSGGGDSAETEMLIQAFSNYLGTFQHISPLELLPGANFIPSPKNMLRWRCAGAVRRSMLAIIAARREQLMQEAAAPSSHHSSEDKQQEPSSELSSDSPVDLLGLMMTAGRHEHSAHKDPPMSDQQLMDECVTFLAAGHDTTAVLLSWTMLMLALNPEWQDKAREEARRVVGDAESTLEFDQLGELPVIGMVLNETLRLFPPASQVARTCTRAMKVSDSLTIPAGCDVMVVLELLHKNKDVWGEDADRFRPDRFANGPSAFGGYFMPFSVGPRVCIGQNFAYAEAKTILAFLLLNFSWEVSPAYKHEPVFMMTLRAKHGFSFIMKTL